MTTYATSTTEFIGADRGQVIAAKTNKVGPGFKPIEGTEEIIKADLVLLAMGFTGAEKSLFEQFGVQSVYDDYSTNNDRVFVAGDARRGPSLVIWGIREGRKAAEKSTKVFVSWLHNKTKKARFYGEFLLGFKIVFRFMDNGAFMVIFKM